MANSKAHKVVTWFKEHVRDIIQKTEAAPVLEELDKLALRVEDLDKNKLKFFPICLLGQAGVGKSTLINTLIANTEIVVPSGGGTGPLTANALRVIHGDRPAFEVKYHAKKQVSQTRFILESELHRRTKGNVPQEDELSSDEQELTEIHLDGDEQKRARIDDAIGRSSLLVAGAQSATRELTYLADALRWVLGQKLKHNSEFTSEDLARLTELKEALKHGTNETARHFDSAENPGFGNHLRNHACGFLAPLILEMTIHWPSDLLKDSVEIVDLPGIGILSDVYASITSDYLRNRAKAVMLVADSRGIRIDDAELLRSSGFLNRLLHAGNDPAADPVALIVVAVKIDDVAVENWRNDKAANGNALKTKAEHFADVSRNCRADIEKKMNACLREVWEEQDGIISEAKEEVIQGILKNLQVFPVSAPQYRLHCSSDPDEDRPFLPNKEATSIPSLRDAITKVAQDCLAEQHRRAEEAQQRFFGQLRAKLEVLSAQRIESLQIKEEVESFKRNLDEFLKPLQREYDTRRGGFRAYLRKTIPARIESRVGSASATAEKSIKSYLRRLQDAHWGTLRAAVRKEGTFYGARHINLPNDFALKFEEPIAEVWSKEILVELRKETKEFAEYQTEAVIKVLNWARNQEIKVPTRLLEALIEDVKQNRQRLNAVGKEAIEELREKVRAELIKKIEAPIRRKCKAFVDGNQDVGRGVKSRILDLFDELGNDVVEAAKTPATDLLVERFGLVEKEISAAFGEHSEPLSEAAEALVKKQEKDKSREEKMFSEAIELALANMPKEMTQGL